jgi:hypothetical protein
MFAMDRATLKEHLAQAERHIASGERHIERQRELITELERNRRSSVKARDLLHAFEYALSLSIAERTRIREELSADGHPPGGWSKRAAESARVARETSLTTQQTNNKV